MMLTSFTTVHLCEAKLARLLDVKERIRAWESHKPQLYSFPTSFPLIFSSFRFVAPHLCLRISDPFPTLDLQHQTTANNSKAVSASHLSYASIADFPISF
jgi:hypothetical protein